ncbi:MAG TPA: hypothetical protein VFK35_13155 [Candidatus Limnocylindrales bacterium]|nr:hypothetical protein [Candidatus Limnocylindrales bacterium]
MPELDTGSRSALDRRGPARHELPAVDEAGLAAARHADRLVAAAADAGAARWHRYFEPMPDRLRDDEPRSLRQVALRARAAYGPKDSVRDALPADVTEPFLEAIDRLLKQLNRRDTGVG